MFVHELPTEMLTKLCLLAGSRLEREDRNMPGYADFAHRHHGDFPGASARLKCAFVSLTPQVQPDGAAIFVGTSSGAILEWKLPAQVRKRRIVVVVSERLTIVGSEQALRSDAAPATSAAASSSDCIAFPTSPAGHGSRVDSLVSLPGGRVASKSGDGRVIVWDIATKAQAAALRVPGCTAGSSRGRLGSSPDGSLLLAGGAPGELHVFDSSTGSKLATLTSGKVRK